MKQLEKVGIMLAGGYTKKEIACIMHRSIHTISQETRVLYQRTGSRNLADITRKMIAFLFHIDIDSELASIMKQIIVVTIVFGIVVTCILFPDSIFNALQTSVTSVINLIK
jgi:hypothetical protein